MKLSIAMMVKNESKHLDDCLKALMPIIDKVDSELIIVDTGSTDNTLEIAKKYTDKVYFHKWNDNFSEMRNITINYSTGEWIFIIDGDEVLKDTHNIIRFFNENICDKYNGAAMSVLNVINEDDYKEVPQLTSLRFFRNDGKFHFEGAVHNRPISKGPNININAKLIHYGYVNTDKELMKKKFKRTSTILKRELKKNPEDIYYLFQLSVSYAMHRDFYKSLKPIKKAYKLICDKKLDKSQYIYVYTEMAKNYLYNGIFDKCENICKEGLNLRNDIIDLHYYLAISQQKLKKFHEAIKSYDGYFKAVEEYKSSKVKDLSIVNYSLNRTDEMHINEVSIYSFLKDYDKVFECAEKVESTEVLKGGLSSVIKAFLHKKDYKGLKNFIFEKCEEDLVNYNFFYNTLENEINKLEENEKIEAIENFQDVKGTYGFLNKVRVSMKNEDYHLTEDVLVYIKDLDFKVLPIYYGDIIYYLLNAKKNFSKFITNLTSDEIANFALFLVDKYKEDISERVYEYVACLGEELSKDISGVRMIKVLEKAVLAKEDLDDTKYREIMKSYINHGVIYIDYIYSKLVIENEMIYDLKDDEEAFLLYLYKARQAKESDEKLYIDYLRKALKVYPYLKKVVEILKDDFEDKLNNVNPEFESYKVQVKNTIENLIKGNDLTTAEALIKEYEGIVKDDMEIVLFKSEIELKKSHKSNKGKYKFAN